MLKAKDMIDAVGLSGFDGFVRASIVYHENANLIHSGDLTGDSPERQAQGAFFVEARDLDDEFFHETKRLYHC